MIELSNLSIRYGDKCVIDNLNHIFKKSTITGIIGESGTGKTSLALSLLAMNEGEVLGEIIYQGENVLLFNDKKLRQYRGKNIAMVFQNGQGILNPGLRIIDQVIEVMVEHRVCNKSEALERASKLLLDMNIAKNHHRKYPSEISGGQVQKVQIAIALANDPDVLILDEFTSALDSVTKLEVIKLIKGISKDKSVIMISHDISLVKDLADEVMVLYRGEVCEYGKTEIVLNKPRHPYTRGLIRSFPNMDTTKDLQGIKGSIDWTHKGCPFYNRCTQRIDICKNKKVSLEKSGDRFIACHRGGIINLMEVKNLHKSYNKEKVLKNLSLSIKEGETLAVVGESGSGKSTLAKCMVGLEKKCDGEIFFENQNLKDARKYKSFNKNVQMIFQDPRSSVNMKMTIYDIMSEPLKIHKIGDNNYRMEKAKELLKEVQLPIDERALFSTPDKFSGGELQRLAIARALMLEPKVLIADEPTSALDVSVQAKIMKLLLSLQEKRGLAIMFVTHDIALARKVSDSMIVIKEGQIVENGSTPVIIDAPKHPYTKTLLRAASGE
ncbi:MAG: ABC transporter ATP-binding protein [Firmicutes bacterium]|jgi:peptide/nickel transport system ATP-binding protein|nr:ABC transporter ATP-binding protein [Bacillota bacterium]